MGRRFQVLAKFLVAFWCTFFSLHPRFLHAGQGTFSPDEGTGTAMDHDLVPNQVIHWRVHSATSFDQGYVLVTVGLETERDFALYREKVTFSTPNGLILEKIKAPATDTIVDPLSEKHVDAYRKGEFSLLFSGLEPYTAASFPLTISYQGCAQGICLFPFEETITVPTALGGGKAPLEIFSAEDVKQNNDDDQEAEDNDEGAAAAVGEQQSQPPGAEGEQPGLEDRLARLVHGHGLSLFFIFLIAFLGGLLTNLTPCVYPMIPITIRLLGRLGKKPLPTASSYGLGIVASYTALGVFAAFTGSLFGGLMASSWVNLGFATAMVFLGVSMLGYGNFAFLQRWGSNFGEKSHTLKKAFLMGVGAGLVASPCTGPILAAMLSFIATRQSSLASSALLIFVYSLGFALPYVVLGGVSAKIASIKVSAPLQNAVKLGFSAMMFALACYYLRVPFYRWLELVSPYWKWLSILFVLLGSGLTLVILPHTWRKHAKGILLLPSVLLGLGIFSSSQWAASSARMSARGAELKWFSDEEEAFAAARKSGKPLLIDMWAEWCEACKRMDATTFSDAGIIATLQQGQWVLLRLDLTEATERTTQVQEKYQVSGLPTLVIVPVGGDLSKKISLPGYVSAAVLKERLRMP